MNVEFQIKDEYTSWEDLANLLHEAFQERLDQGMRFTCSFMNADELRYQMADSIVLIAKKQENSQLVGMAAIDINQTNSAIWGYMSNLAIRSEFKRCGIMSSLHRHLVDIAESNGCKYIKSDTAVGAESSVKWHLKNGFKKAQLHSFSSTNYYSIIFRKQLVPHPLWSNSFYCWFRFQLSALKCRMCFHADGKPTWLMKRYLKIRQA